MSCGSIANLLVIIYNSSTYIWFFSIYKFCCDFLSSFLNLLLFFFFVFVCFSLCYFFSNNWAVDIYLCILERLYITFLANLYIYLSCSFLLFFTYYLSFNFFFVFDVWIHDWLVCNYCYFICSVFILFIFMCLLFL